MANNSAAWYESKGAHPFGVKSAPYTPPSNSEVVVKVAATAINPVDWKIQTHGVVIENFPAILGCDLAGVVHEVGPDVTTFKKGDRVFGHSQSLMTGKYSMSAFQEYVVLPTVLASKIPENLTFEQASVIPLGLDTAATGMFLKDFLSMDLPSASPTSKNKTIFIWGGSSSVGSMGIQLAVAAGYNVVTTASARNHSYVKGLGASEAFDYNDSNCVSNVASALKGKTVVGAMDTISEEQTIKSTCSILSQAGGGKLVASVLPGTDKLASDGCEVKPVFGLSPAHNEVGPAIWGGWLEEALRTGQVKAKPDPLVIGKGLENVQKAVDANKAGLSAQKAVVSL